MKLEKVYSQFREIGELIFGFPEKEIKKLNECTKTIVKAYRNGGKLVLFGNGGSAADAQHIAAELVGRFEKDRQSLYAIALTTNTSILTAIGNDYDFNKIFSRQVNAIVKKGDVVVGISTSGRSRNVIEGLKTAKEIGAFTIAFTGGDGGEIKNIADLSFIVPSKRTARIQEVHIIALHIMCSIVEEELFG